ncbi:MAG: hypothetical protein JNK82_07925 [Myxococcaceae bacterium]|nr:hypothetical protein [Myxococcaceae bacterium]
MRRSTALLKKTWGEQVVGNSAVGARVHARDRPDQAEGSAGTMFDGDMVRKAFKSTNG